MFLLLFFQSCRGRVQLRELPPPQVMDSPVSKMVSSIPQTLRITAYSILNPVPAFWGSFFSIYMTEISHFVAIFSIKFGCASFPPPLHAKWNYPQIKLVLSPFHEQGTVGGGIGSISGLDLP